MMNIKENRMYLNGILLFCINIFSSGLNYLCQILMARVLGADDFGTISIIFSFLLILGVPGTSLTMTVCKFFADETSKTWGRMYYYKKILKYILLFALLIFIIGGISFPILGNVLKIEDHLVLALTICLVSLGLYHPFFSGVLSGYKLFIAVGIYSLLIPIYKIIATLVAIMTENIHSRLYIVMIGILLGTIITALLGSSVTKKLIKKENLDRIDIDHRLMQRESVDILVINFILMVYMNIDLFVVRRLENETVSGLYSADALFGRIAYYFATTLGTILLPIIVSKKEKVIFAKFFMIMGFFCIIVLVPINLFKTEIIALLYGNGYLGAAGYVKYVSLISVALSFMTLIANYSLGIGKTKIIRNILLFLLCVLLCIIITIKETEIILACISFIGIITAVIMSIFIFGKKEKRFENTIC